MKHLLAILLLAAVPPDVLQNLKSNVEKENLEEKIEEEEARDEYLESHRYDEPKEEDGEKEKDHGRDNSE